MALPTGTRLGTYEILSSLGAGGMGEVYRARDTKLGREVAIKLVLEAFLTDKDRLVRFEREARSLAAINHPNIATLFGLEESGGRHFLVMELVDGLTLGELLARGPLALEHAVVIARQIAEALEAAHEKGIVHRDLKPANVKITPDDKVKVLDFGLAKASEGAEAGGGHGGTIANSPTLTAMGTQAGMILGTASYMSPEQARGASGDHRSDVFSFGVVLYEMLTGRQPFQGDTVSDVLASVLARDPDLAQLPPDLSPRLSELVKRCLDKHPKRRWQAIGDVRHELESLATNPRQSSWPAVVSSTPSAPASLWRRALPVSAAIALTAASTAGIFMATRPAPPVPVVSRFVVPYGAQQVRTATSRPSLAISPDGTLVAYAASREIFVRTLADFDARILSRGSAPNLASTPFSLVFSPNSRSIAYWDQGDEKIKRLELSGGAPVPISAATAPQGITWHGDHLYFTTAGNILRVLASGGEPEVVVTVKADETLTAAHVLPDGRLLFSIAPPGDASADRWVGARVVAQRPGDDASRTVLVEGGSDPRYLPSGHLLYQSGGILFARLFDPGSNAVGNAIPMVEGVLRGASSLGSGLAWYGIASNGTLIYIPGPVGAIEQDLRIAWFNRAGQPEFVSVPSGPYQHPRATRDGKRIAFVRVEKGESAVWVHELTAGASARRLTFGGQDRYPIWSHDGQRVIFQSTREGTPGIFWQRADGTAERLTSAAKGVTHIPLSVSPDGSVMLFDQVSDETTTLMVFSFKDRSAVPFGEVTSLTMTGAAFSPDGKWVAYSTRESRQTSNYTYVQPYPSTGAKYQISTSREDGHHQVWSPDGRELFYTPGPGPLLMSVKVSVAPTFTFSPGDPVARPFTNNAPNTGRTFDVGGPGVRLLGLIPPGLTDGSGFRTDIHIVLNWVEEVRARVK
jgi:serine/threonine protein kinase